MKHLGTTIMAATLLILAGCGGKGDDAAGDAVADNADAVADAMDNRADALENQGFENQAEALENKADAVRDAGEKKEEAIDEADINATNTAAP